MQLPSVLLSHTRFIKPSACQGHPGIAIVQLLEPDEQLGIDPSSVLADAEMQMRSG